jgi:hypothetical protein
MAYSSLTRKREEEETPRWRNPGETHIQKEKKRTKRKFLVIEFLQS